MSGQGLGRHVARPEAGLERGCRARETQLPPRGPKRLGALVECSIPDRPWPPPLPSSPSRTFRSASARRRCSPMSSSTVGEGERLALVGRNGSGKSTLLKIAAGLVEPDRGERFAAPGHHGALPAAGAGPHRLCHCARLCRGGLAPGDDPLPRAHICSTSSASPATEDPAKLSGGEARRAALARALAPEPGHPAPRRADQPSRPAGDRMAGGGARAHALGDRAGQPRPALPRPRCRAPRSGSIAAHAAARPRLRATSRPGATRCWSRRSATATSSTARSPREEDWMRYGVTARRKRNRAAARALHELRRERREQPRVGGAVRFTGPARRSLRQAGDRGQGRLQGARRTHARPRSLAAHRARRPARHRRPERRRQDDAAQHADRRLAPG